MCYAAQIVQTIRDYQRDWGVELDWEAARRLFWERRNHPQMPITISRAFEANFNNPVGDAGHEIAMLIDQHRDQQGTQLESELFTQKTRLNNARRKLAAKVTKSAQNDLRIAGAKIEAITTKLANLRSTDVSPMDARIYPKHYAGIIVMGKTGPLLTPMRYLCRPEGKPASYDIDFPGLYNARRDNLERFWRNHFGTHHAVAVLDSFFENVKQHDIERRPLAQREKEINVVLQFKPQTVQPMLVACLWSPWTHPTERSLQSFAIITDEPPAEIAATGHDRCPISIRPENMMAWLTPEGRGTAALQTILSDRQQAFYEHALAA